MRTEHILKKARRILQTYHTRDPFKLAEDLGITVRHEDSFDELLGMYMVIKRKRFIVLNANMERRLMKIILAHEIGHDQFHRHLAKSPKALQNFGVIDMTSQYEREANIFAAEILIDDKWILDAPRDWSVDMLAGDLETDVDFLMVKLAIMEKQGCKVTAPYSVPSEFLEVEVKHKDLRKSPHY